nr:ABC-2 family transporter protein [Paenibacillus planticolens]
MSTFHLTYIFPIAFITTFPASALIGHISGWQVAWSVGIALVCLALTRVLWKFALRHYTSASS